jgi:phosphatidylglycerophosphatase A
VRKWVVTGLGTGYLPVAPGTWGSAAATVVFVLAAWLGGGSGAVATAVMAAVAVLASAACVTWGPLAETTFGRKDPRQCTIDEWAGQAVTFCFLPLRSAGSDLLVVAAVGFLAFRLFDIVKVPPARRLERLPDGWGVLADDLVAGVYANAAAQLVLRFALAG